MSGLFDELTSDPVSAPLDKTVLDLNLILVSTTRSVSWTDITPTELRNPVKQFSRHLRTYVSDELLLDQWSDDTLLPLIVFALNSRSTPETGDYTPL